jgi:UDP-2,3-diacylglucosamine pyrophosphatase LpxH
VKVKSKRQDEEIMTESSNQNFTPPHSGDSNGLIKRKIKVVMSDLHLGKGRLSEGDQSRHDLEEFLYDQKLIEFIHYYSSGEYLESEVELIINGDFLNLLQVDYKGHYLTVLTESVCVEMLRSVVVGHREVFKALADFLRKTDKVVTYIVGNHDQAMLWPGCRELLNQTLGAQIRYKNIVYFFDGVHIEHGHMHEAANRFDPRRFFLKKDLVEPILNLPLGSLFFLELVLKIKYDYPYVDKIRPFFHMAKWTLFNKPGVFLKAVVWVLGFLYKGFFKKDPRRNITFKELVQITRENILLLDLSESAKMLLKDPKIHTVIFGHNHVYEYRKWGESKEYFNSGTWTEVVSLDIATLGKITKLTYIYLEWNTEKQKYQGRLKEWKGYHRVEEEVAIA